MRRLIATATLAVIAASLPAASALAQGRIVLAPHKVTYDLELGEARDGQDGKRIAMADGRLAFDFGGDACSGYTLAMRQVTRVDDGEGNRRLSDMRMTSWEEGKGKTLRFNSTTYTNGQITQQSEGAAERAQDGFSIKLRRPTPTSSDFKDLPVFPNQHMIRMIEAARRGESIVEIKFFDGSDTGEKMYDTLAVIGREIASGSDLRLEAPARAAGLAGVRRWPVKLSYFEQGQGERTPEFIMSFDLFENGVSGSLKIDFGSFLLKGGMKTLEMGKDTECKE